MGLRQNQISFFLKNFPYLTLLGLHCCLGFSLGLLASCGVWASHYSGFYCCRAWTLGHTASVVAVPGLQSTGSAVAAHGLSCSAARGIFPDQGSNPRLPYWQVDSLPPKLDFNSCSLITTHVTRSELENISDLCLSDFIHKMEIIVPTLLYCESQMRQ